MHSNEQAVADLFNRYLRDVGSRNGIRVHDFSLGGQDRDAGADYLLSDSSRFALVEFKYAEANISDESRKLKRLTLCQLLPLQPAMRLLHDQCHFIAWSHLVDGTVHTNIYRREVCNRRVFGDGSKLQDASADASSRATAATFAEGFLDAKVPGRSLALKDFEAYLAWLMRETSGASASTLELLTSDPLKQHELKLVRFSSVDAAYRWMQENKPKPSPERVIKTTPRSPGPGG
jgi:hypothetical protein